MCIDEPILPNLELLTPSDLKILDGSEQWLRNFLRSRCDLLKLLTVRSCRVYTVEYKSELGDLVKELEWEDMAIVGLDYTGSDYAGSDSDSD